MSMGKSHKYHCACAKQDHDRGSRWFDTMWKMDMEYTKHFIFLNIWVINIQAYSKRNEKKLDTKRRKWYLLDIHQITKYTIYRTHIHTKSQLHLIWTLMKEPIIFDKLIHDVVYQYLWLTMDISCPTIVQKTMWVQHQQEDHTRGCNMKVK
jgi:hypothetical protein